MLLIPNVGRQKKPPTALMCKYLSLPLKKRVGGGFLVCWGGKKKNLHSLEVSQLKARI